MNIYRTTRGQMLTLWIFGIIFCFGDLIYILDQYSTSGFSLFLLLFVPAALVFYSVGWRAHNPKIKKETPTPVIKASTADIKGIGGWLKFFLFTIFVSLVINFLAGIADISTIFNNTSLTQSWMFGLALIDIIYFGGIIILGIYAVLAFSKLKPNAVALGKMFLVIMFVSGLGGVLSIANGNSSTDASQEVWRGLVYSGVWFTYLSCSKRVSNTFPKEIRVTKAADQLLFGGLLAITIIIAALPLL